MITSLINGSHANLTKWSGDNRPEGLGLGGVIPIRYSCNSNICTSNNLEDVCAMVGKDKEIRIERRGYGGTHNMWSIGCHLR